MALGFILLAAVIVCAAYVATKYALMPPEPDDDDVETTTKHWEDSPWVTETDHYETESTMYPPVYMITYPTFEDPPPVRPTRII